MLPYKKSANVSSSMPKKLRNPMAGSMKTFVVDDGQMSIGTAEEVCVQQSTRIPSLEDQRKSLFYVKIQAESIMTF